MLAHDFRWPLLDVLEAHAAPSDQLPLVLDHSGEVIKNQQRAVR